MNWLFLRGLAREARHWGSFPTVFAAHFPAANIVTLDLPGLGAEYAGSSPLSIGGIVDDVRARWQNLGGSGDWSLLTISLGGMVGLDWCSRYPEDFARHAVINTSARELGKPWERLNWRYWPEVFALLASNDPYERELRILKLTSNLQTDLPSIANHYGSFPESHPAKKRNVVRQLIASASFRLPAQISMPTLVLSSSTDRFVSAGCSRALASRYGFEHSIHHGAGHDLPLDAPHWVCQQISTWLLQHSAHAMAVS